MKTSIIGCADMRVDPVDGLGIKPGEAVVARDVDGRVAVDVAALSPTTSILGGRMVDTRGMIERAYSAFNKRDIDGALALMTEDVSWPKASEGGRIVGKEEVRAYWTRQWREFDGHVEPISITQVDGGRVRVSVRQLVKNLQGDVLSDSEVLHLFTVDNGLIASMDLGDQSDAAGPTAAFARRP